MKPSVLIVEKAEQGSAQTSSVLSEYGYEAHVAHSCEECLEQIADKHTPRLLLIDIDLGEGKSDGAATAERVLQSYDLPIVFIASDTDRELLARTEGIKAFGYVLRSPGYEAFLASTLGMAIRLHESESLLRESEEKDAIFHNAIEVMHEGLVIHDSVGTVSVVNRRAKEILGRSEEELLTLDSHSAVWESVHPDGRPFPGEEHPAMVSLRTGSSLRHVPMGLTGAGRERVWISINSDPIFSKRDGSITGAVVSFREVTKEFNYQREIETILDSVNASIYVADMESYEILFLNSHGQKIFGDVVGEKCWKVLHRGDEGPCSYCTNDRLLDEEGKPTEGVEWEYRNSVNGRWYKLFDRAIWWYDKPYVRLEIATDITEVKRIAEERQNLLIEMNHRIKNNLFTVEALAKIELSHEDKSKEDSIRDIIGRVQAIGLVHQKLYSSGVFSSVQLRDYLEDLGKTLVETLSTDSCRFDFVPEIEKIELNAKKMTSLGIITVELVTNTQKYSRCSGSCEIHLSARREGDTVYYDYEDSGIGLGSEVASIDDVNEGSGLMLIQALAQELGGEAELLPPPDRGHAGGRGMHLRLSFPLPCAETNESV